MVSRNRQAVGVVSVAVLVAVAAVFGTAVIVAADEWDGVRTVLEDAIADGAFPGCVAAVGNKEYVWQ